MNLPWLLALAFLPLLLLLCLLLFCGMFRIFCMKNLKNVKNKIILFVALFGLLLSAVSPSLALSAQDTQYDLITVYAGKGSDIYLCDLEQIGVVNLSYYDALASACYFSRQRLAQDYSYTALSHLPTTSQGWKSLFSTYFFSSINISEWGINVYASGVNGSPSSSKIILGFLKKPASIPNYQSGSIFFQPPVIYSTNPSFSRVYLSLLLSSPAGNVSSESLNFLDGNSYYTYNPAPVSVPLTGFDSNTEYILSLPAFTVIIDSSLDSYQVYEGVYLPNGIRTITQSFDCVPLCMTYPLFYGNNSSSSVNRTADSVTLGSFTDIPNMFGWYYSNFQAEFFVSPTPIPTVLPTLSPTPIILPYDSSVDLVTDGSTMGFLDTIQGTFDGLKGLAVLTFFGDLITFIYHESNVFGVLLLFIPLISFIVFLIGRSK